MKRPYRPNPHYEPPNLDPAKDLSGEQLRLIGAIAIAWNYLEVQHNTLFSIATRTPVYLMREIAPRINGFEGIKAVTVKSINKYIQLPDEVRKEAVSTLEAAHESKAFRDALIHSTVLMPQRLGLNNRGGNKKAWEILITEEALSYLHRWTVAIAEELGLLCLLLDEFMAYSKYLNESKDRPENLAIEIGSDEALSAQFVQDHLTRFRESQSHRRSLRRPTKFPEGPPRTPKPLTES